MAKRKLLDDQSSISTNECLVCGDKARGLNFNVMTCMACKTFFRKNVFKKSRLFCEFDQNCTITKRTRGYCSYCRLKKCLALGMNAQLLKKIPQSNIQSQQTKPPLPTENRLALLPTPPPISLLRNDRSTLTFDEWILLSNFLHAYEEHNACTPIQSILHKVSSLPPKMRLRTEDVYDIVGQFFTSIQPLIERSPDLNALSVDARRALIKHNLNSTGAFHGIFLCRQLDLYNNPFFWNTCLIAYGPEFMSHCTRNTARCDPNSSLIKMMLFVYAFSSNCSIVTYDPCEPMTAMTRSMDLFVIQNVYVTMLWKYLIYLYGFKEAVIRYSYIIKNILDVTHMLELMPKNDTHNQLVETIITETEQALVIKD